MSEMDKTLAQRGEVYGRFVDHAAISQSIKRAMRAAPIRPPAMAGVD